MSGSVLPTGKSAAHTNSCATLRGESNALSNAVMAMALSSWRRPAEVVFFLFIFVLRIVLLCCDSLCA